MHLLTILILMRSNAISETQLLSLSVLAGAVFGFIIGTISYAKYSSFIKSFLNSLLFIVIAVVVSSRFSPTFTLGLCYSAHFGVIISLIIGHYANKNNN